MKWDYFLAFPAGNDAQREVLWDMLRYDRCYPVNNCPSGWIVLIQPNRDSIVGGWTVGRWRSFNVRFAITTAVRAGTTHGTIPMEMMDCIRRVNDRFALGHKVNREIQEGWYSPNNLG